MRKFPFTFLLIILALLMGCVADTFSGYVTQKPGEGVVITFFPDSKKSNSEVEIKTLYVGRVISSDNQMEIVWRIQTKSGKPQKITTIQYGVVPLEFEEIDPAQKLISGETYNVYASKPKSAGSARFKKE